MKIVVENYRGDGWLYARWRENGEVVRRSLRTKDYDQARRAAADLERRLLAEAETIGEQWQNYINANIDRLSQPDRIHAAWKALKGHFAHLRPDQITPMACRTYTAARRKAERKNGTIRKELSTLRQALNWVDPKNNANFELPEPPPPRDIYLSREQAALLLEESMGTAHLETFVRLGLQTAARKSALFELTWDRVDFKMNRITLDTILIDKLEDDVEDHPVGRIQRKGRAVVPMPKSLRAHLEMRKEQARTNFVIEWRDAPIADIKTAFNKARKRCLERTGDKAWQEVSPHILRHTAAVWMAMADEPMTKIAEYLGHTKPNLTARVYAKYSPNYLESAATALELDFAPKSEATL